MNKIKNELNNNRFFYVGLLFVFLLKIIYLMNATANVPIMDYWRYAYKMLPKIYGGGITFSDLWEPINGQRGFLNHSLFYLNVKLFHWNTRVEIFGGSLFTLLSTVLLYRVYNKNNTINNLKTNIIRQIIGILFAIIMFNFQQWEIETEEFSLSFSIIILLLFVNTYLTDELLVNDKNAKKYILVYCIILGLSICFVMSAFFPAMVFSLGLIGIISFIMKNKDEKMQYIKYYIAVIFSILISMYFYFDGMVGITSESTSLSTFFDSIKNGEFFKAVLYYLGGSLLHTDYYAKNILFYYFVGVFVLLLYIISIFLFFKDKIYKISFVPFGFIIYALMVGLLLSYGRGTMFESEYLISSRYVYQSKVGLIGVAWIMSLKLCDNTNKAYILKRCFVTMIFAVMMFLYADAFFKEKTIEPYRRIYCETAIKYIENPDTIENNYYIFQDTQEHVDYVIPLMKKYKLGIFYH